MEIPVGYAQANIFFVGSAMPTGAQVTLGLDVSAFGGGPAAAAEAVGQEIIDAGFPALMTVNQDVQNVLVKYGPPATGAIGESGFVASGTAGAGAVPPNTALLVRKVTAFGGRSGRGRMYWPGVHELEVTQSGDLNPATVAAYQTAFNAFTAGLVANLLVPVLLHGDGSPFAPFPLTQMTVLGRVATQRRRLRR